MHTLYKNPENNTPTFIIHDILPPEVCNKLIEAYKDKTGEGSHYNKTGELDIQKEVRDSGVVFINEPHVMEKLQTSIKISNHVSGWNLDITATEDIQFTKYGPEQHYNWHEDGTSCSFSKRRYVFEKPNGLNETNFPHLIDTCRKISGSVILNDDFSGGEFEVAWLASNTGELELKKSFIKPKMGDIIIFPSYLPHRVRPVKVGTRYSLVIWAGGPSMK
jgi:PKHD-type hydroxylase